MSCFGMLVPDELSLQPGEANVLAVQFGDEARRPWLERVEVVGEVDRVHLGAPGRA